jgi:AraC-like DNA-binding protein
MESIHFSTAGLLPQDQFEAWREWFGSAFDVHPADSEAIGFKAEYRAWQIGDLILPSGVAPATRSVRSMTNLRRHPVDHWAISWGHDGPTYYETKQGRLLAPARVSFVWSAGQVSSHTHFPPERGTARRRQLYLPRDSFRDIAGKLDAAVGSRLDTPMGVLLVGFLTSLEEQLPAITAAEVPAIEAALRALVAGITSSSAEALAEAHPQIALPQLEKVRRVVQAGLRSANLDPHTLCREAAMSRSALYRLLEPQGGVARFIQRARLTAARNILRDPVGRASISSIAEDFCFCSATAFSRAFRVEFGCSPRDVRDARQVGLTNRSDRPAGRWEDILAAR